MVRGWKTWALAAAMALHLCYGATNACDKPLARTDWNTTTDDSAEIPLGEITIQRDSGPLLADHRIYSRQVYFYGGYGGGGYGGAPYGYYMNYPGVYSSYRPYYSPYPYGNSVYSYYGPTYYRSTYYGRYGGGCYRPW